MAVPRFRTPATQTTPPQETAPTALPRQSGPPAAPAPPPTTETRPTMVQPQAPLTNPALNFSPAPLPTIVTPSPSLPSAVTPAPTQQNFATSKPASPQPRFVTSATPSSPTTKTETVMRSSPQRTAAPTTVSSPRFPTDKSLVRTSTPQSPVAPKPQTITSVISASPTRESSSMGNSFIKKSYLEPSTTPTTSPMRKVSAPSPEARTLLGSRSPPPSEPLPTAVPDGVYTPTSSPRDGKTLSKTPPQSTLIRPLSHPPSPLTLPPAQIKTAINHEPSTFPKDQTTVITQERNGKPKVMPRVPDTYEFMETTYKYIGQDGEGKDAHEKITDAEQSGTRVIRLAGENHGAIMELSPSRTKGNRNGRKTGTDYGKGNEEESSNKKNNKSMAIQAPPLTAFMNSNVQGMNNSIVYNTSCTHNDPGVHLSFTRKPNGGYVKDHIMD
ncbi:hypothetical protein Leryth_027306 [Lithospermum erythrorhizon]|nr:hypothetical protein Leryth_027306 [Lithospermum erythrorhizon]